jgi:hypothetical protein
MNSGASKMANGMAKIVGDAIQTSRAACAVLDQNLILLDCRSVVARIRTFFRAS